MTSTNYKLTTNSNLLLILTLLSLSATLLLTACVSTTTTAHNSIQSRAILIKQALPQTIRYGKRTSVTVKLKTEELELIRPYLATGGPTISNYLKPVIPGKAHIILTATIADTLFAYTSDKQILRINTNTAAPSLTTSNNLKFTADKLFTSQNTLWISQDNNLYELDQHKLAIKNKFRTTNKITDVDADHQNIYILTGKFTIEVFKRNNIEKSDSITSFKLKDPARALAIKNKKLFITTSAGIIAINMAAIDGSKIKTQNTFTTSGSPQDIIINNNLAYIADGPNGLTVIDVSKHQQMQLIGSYNKLGNIKKISLRGNKLITANTNGQLHLLDVSNPVKPVVISSYNTHKKITDINTLGSHALVSYIDHLDTIDFISETMPPISTEGVTLGGSRRGQIVNNLLYVADWFSGLHIYDISDPGNIKHISNYHTKGSSKGVLVHNGYAFVGDDDHGLQIIDVRDVKNPTWVSELATPGLGYTMTLTGNTLYLADHRGGFHIINVSNIKQPVRLGGIDTPGKAWAIEVYKNRAYVADDSTGLLVFDVSKPSDPKLVGQFNPGGFAEDIKISNGLAYVAFFDKGLYILDLDSPITPKLLSHLDIPGNARGIGLDHNDKNYAYISSWYAGLQIVNISNNKKPVITGYYDTDGATWGTVQSTAQNKDIIYALDWWEGIKSINIKNKQRPVLISRYQAKDTISDLAIKGNYIFTTNNHSGLQVHDIRNPLNPMWITGMDLPGSSHSILIRNNHAFIQTSEKIIIIDIKDPFRIKPFAEIQSDKPVTDIQITKNIAYIGDNSNTINAFDLNNKHYLKKISSISITDCEQFQVSNTLLICSNSKKDLFFYRVDDDKHKITLIKKQTSPTKPALFRISKNYIFLYSNINKQLTAIKNNASFNTAFTTTLPQDPAEIHVYNDILYLSSSKGGLQSYLIKNDKLIESTNYLASKPVSKFVKNNDQIFFAGSHKLSSLKLLPKIKNISLKDDSLFFDIPAGMPLGSYTLHLTHPTTGHQQFPNLFQVEFPKFRQPQFK